MTRREFLRFSSVLGLGAALAACGGTAAPAASPSSSSPAASPGSSGGPQAVAGQKPVAGVGSTPVASTSAPANPGRGGSVRLPLTADATFDPIVAQEPNSVLVGKTIFSQLVRPAPNTFEPQPDLAKSWEVSADGLSWTFHLVDNAEFHDGTPVTSDDVKFSYERILDKTVNSQLRSGLDSISSIEAPDPHTVRFVLSAPYAPLAVRLADNNAILPKHLLDGKDIVKGVDAFNKRTPVGSGPFKVQEVVAGDHVTVVPFDKHFRGRPNLDSIIFKIVPDLNAQIAQLKAGELDAVSPNVPSLSTLTSASNLSVYAVEQAYYDLLYLNNKRSPWNDQKVRLAAWYGLDRQKIIDAVYGGKATLATQSIPPIMQWAYDTQLKPIPYDAAKAKSLLAEAGWQPGGNGILAKNGSPLKFTITVDNDPSRSQIATIIQQYYKQLGMDVQLEVMEFGAFVSQRYVPRTYDTIVTYKRMAVDPDETFDWACDGSTNVANYCNQELTTLLKQARAETDQNKRKQDYIKFQELMQQDVPSVILDYPQGLVAVNKAIQGWPAGFRFPDVTYYAGSWYLQK